MLRLPVWIMTLLSKFAPAIYGESTWYKVEVLVVGAILATDKQTVSAILRVMGLSQDRNYAKYHHVLSRASWSGLALSRILLGLLLKTFSSMVEPLVFGIDETIERRRGEKIAAKGIYRDAEPLLLTVSDDDGDGWFETHTNSQEGLWTGLRNFLRPFRGVHKCYLDGYVAIHEARINLKAISPTFIGALVHRYLF